MIKRFFRDETGLELSEYAVAAALVAIAVVGAFSLLGTTISTKINEPRYPHQHRQITRSLDQARFSDPGCESAPDEVLTKLVPAFPSNQASGVSTCLKPFLKTRRGWNFPNMQLRQR